MNSVTRRQLGRRFQHELLRTGTRRWSSTFDKRKLSTPLARDLAKAITVCDVDKSSQISTTNREGV